VQSARDFALQNFAKDLIASIDNLEHALSSIPAERLSTSPPSPQDAAIPGILQTIHKDLVSLHKGLQLTESVLMETLKRHGLTRFDPAEAGEKFDPNVHEAVFQAPVPGKEEGTVFHTQQKGFMLNGRVIRAPKVGVVKNQ
jgi:molecular chaperone GrpE